MIDKSVLRKIFTIIVFLILSCLIFRQAGVCQEGFYPAQVKDISDRAYGEAGFRIQDAGNRSQDTGHRLGKAKGGEKLKSYEDLEIYKLAKSLAIEVHKITMNDLPKFEMYEEGSQIRRSSKSIGANIVEGFGRKRYKGEFVQFLTYAKAWGAKSIIFGRRLSKPNRVAGCRYQDARRRIQDAGCRSSFDKLRTGWFILRQAQDR